MGGGCLEDGGEGNAHLFVWESSDSTGKVLVLPHMETQIGFENLSDSYHLACRSAWLFIC